MMDAVLTIRQMCDKFEVTARTLRFYEDKELIAPIREGQKRLYTKREQVRVNLILQGKRFGFSLENMRELLDLYYLDDQQKTQMERAVILGEQRLIDMEQQRKELDQAIIDIKERLKISNDWLKSAKKKAG
ncbi:MerR family DNA-binding transcriptional regulator [Amylibacter sp. SFDW26]|uniref:MerR family transcriptional regulator n=1 Tax=Amylibacter sp. SFDW26 TaxID=2652722 RepID=UPI00126244A5|nr:MerR family DNA-binding transcriptional regulator [Amylibacter sp. SFDW26]